MNLRLHSAPPLLVLVLLGCLGCSSSEKPSKLCSVDVDCPAAQVCADAGVCNPVEPLTLTDPTQLPAAVKGVPYAFTFAVSGGAPPRSFHLAELPPALSWLRIDVATGALSGTPPSAFTTQAGFQVSVTDDSRQEATKSFQLAVNLCADGDVVECVAPMASGACGRGTAVCSGGAPGKCDVVAPSTSSETCGEACGACAAGESCVGGKCACGDGQPCMDGKVCCADSNGVPACVDPQTDPNNCGVCGRVCLSGVNASTTCVQGQCSDAVICETGYSNCDSAHPANCGTSLTTDMDNCGACGNACDRQRSDACSNGLCACADGVECAPGNECCPAELGLDAGCVDPMVGARTDIGIARCGGCGAALCPDPSGYGTASCSAGACGAVCGTNASGDQFADCNVPDGGTPHDCTTNLANDPAHCGSCGTACPDPTNGDPVCSGGSCDVSCGDGYCRRATVDNELQCLDESNDQSCGASCNYCAVYKNGLTVQGAASTCCSGLTAAKGECVGVCDPNGNPDGCVCGVACTAGNGNCNGDVTDGCEKSLVADVNNCGACGKVCTTSVAHALPTCGSSTCGFACDSGYFKCNGQCLSNQNSDKNHCGSCSNVCSPPANSVGFCSNGTCDFTCNAGYLKCGDSCVPIDDPNNCGACGNYCPTLSDPATKTASYCNSSGQCCDSDCSTLPCQVTCT